MDQRADPCHEERHGHGERIDQKGGVDAEAADGDPGEQGLGERSVGAAVGEQGRVGHDGGHEASGGSQGGHPSRPGVPEPATGQHQHQEAAQGQGRDQDGGVDQ